MLEPGASPRLQRVRGAAPPLDPAAEPPFADGYLAFRDRALASEPASAALLATIAAQAAALALVWEAHARGAATLPPAVAAHVAAAVRAARPAGG